MTRTIHAAQAALFAISAAAATAGAAAERAGQAIDVRQDALQAEGAAGYPVSAGDDILRQARVYTKRQGYMEIRLDDGSRLTVAPEASIVIDDYVYAGEGRPSTLALSLGRGALRMVSGRMPSESVTLATPVATIGLRGTAFWLDASADLLEIWVEEGAVLAQPSATSTVYEFNAPTYARCSASGCEEGAAPPVPTSAALGDGSGGGNGGSDPDRAFGFDSGESPGPSPSPGL